MSANRPGRRLALRRSDRCTECSAELPAGATAWWDLTTQTVTCLGCLSTSTPPPPELIAPGVAGASALREYERRHDAREQHAREKLGGLGVLLAKAIEEPSSTRSWKQGGNGEIRVGTRLEKLLGGTGVLLLHDRRVPRHGQANLDHIAVGPGGITVIDTKTHRGKIRRDWYGGLFTERRTILRIDGRDQTKMITGVCKQVGYVRSALDDLSQHVALDVVGALCFPDIEGLPLRHRIEVNGVLVGGPKHVAQLAGRPGSLEPRDVRHIWSCLAEAFPLNRPAHA